MKFALRWILGCLLVLALLGATGWSALAISLGDSSVSLLQRVLAGAFSLVGISTIVCLFLPRKRWAALGVFVLCFAVVLLWWFNIKPSNDRIWQADVNTLPYATIEGDRVTVHNVRNFKYRTGSDYVQDYYTKRYDLNQLNSVDLFAVYWMGPEIAHTIISFGFGDDDYLAISIEARKELDEGYSAINGFFRQYELIYVVADERDVIGLRTNIRQDPIEDVYRYRLHGSVEDGRALFLAYMKAINDLVNTPAFYNTLFSNCTNLIWANAGANPDRIPFSWKLLASGYAPEYLYEMGKLDQSVPFEELERRGHVNPVTAGREIAEDFSQLIRSGIH